MECPGFSYYNNGRNARSRPYAFIFLTCFGMRGGTSPARPLCKGVNGCRRSFSRWMASRSVGYIENRGTDLFKLANEKGLEGIMAKRKRSIYQSGKRSADWLKIRSKPKQEFIVCGFTEGKGSRSIGMDGCVTSDTPAVGLAKRDCKRHSLD